MDNTRDRNNYPDIVIAPFQDSQTQAVYPQAVYTSGTFNVSSRSKQISYEIDVYASIEAFESGGRPIGTPICRIINQDTVPTYDDVIMGNAATVGAILQILQGIEQELSNDE